MATRHCWPRHKLAAKVSFEYGITTKETVWQFSGFTLTHCPLWGKLLHAHTCTHIHTVHWSPNLHLSLQAHTNFLFFFIHLFPSCSFSYSGGILCGVGKDGHNKTVSAMNPDVPVCDLCLQEDISCSQKRESSLHPISLPSVITLTDKLSCWFEMPL